MLENKVALVTGGARGIGYEIVKLFLNFGAHVYYTDITEGAIEGELLEIAQKKEKKVIRLVSNVSNELDCASVVKKVRDDHGQLDILVNNAGITKDGLIFHMKSEDWQTVLDVNLTGAFYMCREVSSLMIRQRSGSIVNMASVVGEVGNAGQTNYAASKSGLIGLSKSLAKEVASRGVRVNAVAPGFIRTAMTDAIPEPQRNAIMSLIPLGKMGETKDIAHAVLFLASDLSSYITGQVINVNGGMHMGGW